MHEQKCKCNAFGKTIECEQEGWTRVSTIRTSTSTIVERTTDTIGDCINALIKSIETENIGSPYYGGATKCVLPIHKPRKN